jgi:hypothetical protein
MKAAIVIAALAVALLVQSTIAGMSFTAGSRVNLVLVAVIYVALAYGAVTGLLGGCAAGLVQDAIAGGIVGIGGLSKTIRQRQHNRREHIQIRALGTEAVGAAPPVAQALPHARQIAEARRPHTGVLDEQHAVAHRREPRHDFLMALPDEIPIDRGNAQDVRPPANHAQSTRRSLRRQARAAALRAP